MSMADTTERPLPIVSSLAELLAVEKKLYLVEQQMEGGTAEGFRRRIRSYYEADQRLITDRLKIAVKSLRLAGLSEAEETAAIEAAVAAAHAPTKIRKFDAGAWMESANRIWQRQPRKSGPDLFAIAGLVIPDHQTRPRLGVKLDGSEIIEDDGERESRFEKVDCFFSTVRDLYEDAMIGRVKADQQNARALLKMQAVNEARRRANGDDSVFIHTLADKK
jgi:hypothetical protein